MQTPPAKDRPKRLPAADEPGVRLADIAPLLAMAAADGVETDAILQRHTKTGSSSVALIDYFRIERDIARALDDLTAHLSTRKLTYQTGTFVVDQIKKATSLAEAMTSLADYFNMMHGGVYNSVHRSARSISLIIDDSAFPYSIRDPQSLVQLIGECVQIKVHCLLDSLSDGLAAQSLQKVAIVRSGPVSGLPHLSFWPRAPQPAQSAYMLSYDLTLAQKAIPKPGALDLSSDGIFSRVINHLDETGRSHRASRFKDRVGDLIADGAWQQERVAEQLGVSPATLRRRLTEEGTSFRDLVTAGRLKQAERMLQQGRTVQQVTEALNYSDIRAFNRAFKRWKQTTPAAFARACTTPN